MIWWLMIISGMITFTMRFIFLTPIMPQKQPHWAERAMRLVPVSVLSTIILAEILIIDGALAPIENNPRLIAAALAAIIVMVTKSVALTIIGGLSLLWVLTLFS